MTKIQITKTKQKLYLFEILFFVGLISLSQITVQSLCATQKRSKKKQKQFYFFRHENNFLIETLMASGTIISSISKIKAIPKNT